MRAHRLSGMRKADASTVENLFRKSNECGGKTNDHISCRLAYASRNASTICDTSSALPAGDVLALGRRIAGGRRGRCHTAALASISLNNDPVTLARIALISTSAG